MGLWRLFSMFFKSGKMEIASRTRSLVCCHPSQIQQHPHASHNDEGNQKPDPNFKPIDFFSSLSLLQNPHTQKERGSKCQQQKSRFHKNDKIHLRIFHTNGCKENRNQSCKVLTTNCTSSFFDPMTGVPIGNLVVFQVFFANTPLRTIGQGLSRTHHHHFHTDDASFHD
mgnify:CR=1 FL=1